MTETAIVREIEGEKIKVIIIKGEGCKSCGGESCKVEGREFTAKNEKGYSLSIGDTVKVYMPPGKAILASFMILIFPLIMFMVFYFLFGKILRTESEGLKALFGLVGMASGFGLSLLLKKFRKDEDMPEIVRKQE